jgi:very-short-patch-repair endonuclease
MPHSRIEPKARLQARALRRDPTDADRKLWQVCRSLKPLGFHFRRQAPIGPYIADFVWYKGKLVIEVDGGQHAELERARDKRRTQWLESEGYRVLRFWNNDVLKSPEFVGEVLLAEATKARQYPVAPTPDPSPGRGEVRRLVNHG